jgi:hypothetical protein
MIPVVRLHLSSFVVAAMKNAKASMRISELQSRLNAKLVAKRRFHATENADVARRCFHAIENFRQKK